MGNFATGSAIIKPQEDEKTTDILKTTKKKSSPKTKKRAFRNSGSRGAPQNERGPCLRLPTCWTSKKRRRHEKAKKGNHSKKKIEFFIWPDQGFVGEESNKNGRACWVSWNPENGMGGGGTSKIGTANPGKKKGPL